MLLKVFFRLQRTMRCSGIMAQMSRHRPRSTSLRAEIAATAARLMAEDGVDDFATAKRKAARQLGVNEPHMLPGNDEIEEALHAYLALYQSDEHPERTRALRLEAVDIMQTLAPFHPYLTGAVLKGFAGPFSAIELQLFPDSSKEVEIFLLDYGVQFTSRELRRYTGDQARAVSVIEAEWNGSPVCLHIFDPRDERTAMKSSLAGKVMERATIAEVKALIGSDHD